MRKLFLATFLCFVTANVQAAHVKVVKSFSLYGTPKYTQDFENFAYVNPKAPKGGNVTLPNYGGFDSFNPFIFKGIAAGEVAELTLDTLGYSPADDPTSVYPLIAKRFELPTDKSFIGFIIDEKARFSNGDKITADDVIFSFNSLIEKGSPLYRVYYADVERIEKTANNHVRFYFKKGANNRELPLILTQFKIYSAEDWKGKDFAKPTLQAPLGSGPYVVQKFEQGKYIIFKRNPDYWAQNLPSRKGFYNFDTIRYDYYQDTTVTLQALFSGNIDAREEFIAKIWVSGYDNNVVKSGKVIQKELTHNNPAVLQFFGFNLRQDKFKDKKVRQAIGLAFNFDWANENLFYNQYRRIYSYFTNTGMEATGLPHGQELKILKQYSKELGDSVFTTAPELPSHKTAEETRNNLRKAVQLLKEAGYDFVDGKMTNLKTGKALEIEVLSNSANGSSFTRVMLPFIDNLKKIGIKMTFRNLETNIFKNRLDNFDFEVAILALRISQMPGNEQREMWGSTAADIRGSYNIMGIKNQVVDKLITRLIEAKDRHDYQESIRALDRVLLSEHYMIPQWYSPYERVAYWADKLEYPQTDIKTGFDIFTWWAKP